MERERERERENKERILWRERVVVVFSVFHGFGVGGHVFGWDHFLVVLNVVNVSWV